MYKIFVCGLFSPQRVASNSGFQLAFFVWISATIFLCFYSKQLVFGCRFVIAYGGHCISGFLCMTVPKCNFSPDMNQVMILSTSSHWCATPARGCHSPFFPTEVPPLLTNHLFPLTCEPPLVFPLEHWRVTLFTAIGPTRGQTCGFCGQHLALPFGGKTSRLQDYHINHFVYKVAEKQRIDISDTQINESNASKNWFIICAIVTGNLPSGW